MGKDIALSIKDPHFNYGVNYITCSVMVIALLKSDELEVHRVRYSENIIIDIPAQNSLFPLTDYLFSDLRMFHWKKSHFSNFYLNTGHVKTVYVKLF